MIPTSSVIKKASKVTLKGRWSVSIFVISILLIVFFLCIYSATLLSFVAGDLVAGIFALILELFLLYPIALGVIRYFWRLLHDAQDNPIAVFYYFSSKKLYFRSLSIVFALAFKVLLYSILLNIPYFIVKTLTHSFLYELIGLSMPVWTANLASVTVILSLISKIALIFIMLKFYLAPMLFVADDNMEAAEAIHMSSVISKKSYVDFIYLGFSFLGWLLLCGLVIPIIFIFPYAVLAYLIHSRFVISEYNNHIEQASYNPYPSFTV